jgi:hypothetical protein
MNPGAGQPLLVWAGNRPKAEVAEENLPAYMLPLDWMCEGHSFRPPVR